MYADYQRNSYIDLEDHLNAISEMVSKHSKNLVNTRKNKHCEYEIREIRHQIFNLYQEMDEIAEELKKNDLFYDKYFDFLEIEDIIKYTLDRDLRLITESDFDFISKLIKDFYNLTYFKNEVFDNEKFETRYDSYLSDFNDSKTYFYNNICDETMDEDLFIKYCSIIMKQCHKS
jgi:hypothetical protein